MQVLSVSVLAAALALSAVASTNVQFNPGLPESGPFPSNALTVRDSAQKTGLRINLPLPDCVVEVSSCTEIKALNTLDGFSLTPRLRVRFSGPVNLDTLREGIFLVALDNLTNEEYGLGHVGRLIAINQVVYDPDTQTAYAKPDEVLDQHRNYALIVTNAIRDAAGAAIEADQRFLDCVNAPNDGYCVDLAGFVLPVNEMIRRFGGERSIVAASIFTTLSATSWMEKARDLLPNYPAVASPAASRSSFALSELQSILVRREIRATPSTLEGVQISLANLEGVGQISFHTYRSPDFYSDQRQIPQIPTGELLKPPLATNQIAFHAFLPSSPKPASGYPVVIASHGSGDSRFGMSFAVAGTMASAGYATVAINAVGHGFGAAGRLVITDKSGSVTEMSLGGRGIDTNGDGAIASNEGCPGLPEVRQRDCLRQTAIDIMQLVRVIRAGVDLDGDGANDLDANRIHLVGFSMGAWNSTIVAAIDPYVSATVLTAPSATVLESILWSPVNRPATISALAQRVPPVPPNKGTTWDENPVLRDQPVLVNQVPGAIELQNIFGLWEWTQMVGDPIAYAPHLRLSTLPGVPIKRVLFQIATADRTLQPPHNSLVVRAAGMAGWASLYRHDLAIAVFPQLNPDAHRRIIGWWNPAGTSGPTFGAAPAPTITLAIQRQAVDFLSTGLRCDIDQPCILDVNDLVLPIFGVKLFDFPKELPDGPAYIVP